MNSLLQIDEFDCLLCLKYAAKVEVSLDANAMSHINAAAKVELGELLKVKCIAKVRVRLTSCCASSVLPKLDYNTLLLNY